MSARDQMREMLDKLMGTERNGRDNKRRMNFRDPNVCRAYLLGLCPFDILNNTKMDVGFCPKLHIPALRADYEKASKNKDYFYENEQYKLLKYFIDDCDRRVLKNEIRIVEKNRELKSSPEAIAIHEINEKIGTKIVEAEKLGVEGMVEESLELMSQIEKLRNEKAEIEKSLRKSLPPSAILRREQSVCIICSAILSIYDNDQKLGDHFGGKLHIGLIKIRERFKELEDSPSPEKKSNSPLKQILRSENISSNDQ